MNSLRISLQPILHDIENSKDLCIDRLIGSVKKRDGIIAVELDNEKTSQPQLLISFDPDKISKEHIQEIVLKTGKTLDKTFGHLWIKAQDLPNEQRQNATTNLLKNVKGVMNVMVIPTGLIMIEFNKYITEESILTELIEQMGLVI